MRRDTYAFCVNYIKTDFSIQGEIGFFAFNKVLKGDGSGLI